ncbi:MAG: DASH family cryptochrome [Gemmatimonadaceae bacterium]|nr:DASH family cryptochrome [Gemmatimonadaceae bacterium]
MVWLRKDLRLDDHEPLCQAIASGAPVLAVYCLDPRELRTLPSGVTKTGAFRVRFLLEALQTLRLQCRALGGDLVIRRGMPEHVLPALADEIGAQTVWCHGDHADEERRVEHAVARVLQTQGVSLSRCWGATMLHPDDLPWAADAIPDMFTHFRKAVEDTVRVRPPRSAPVALRSPSVAPGDIPSLEQLGVAPPPVDPRVHFAPTGGEQAGQARLQFYLWDSDRVQTYKGTRNGMLDVDDSSKLSPWLAIGCLSPRRVWSEVQRYEHTRVKNESTYWLIFELLWRDYFAFVLAKDGNALFSAHGPKDIRMPWRTRTDRDVQRDFAKWTAGETGFPLIDANMQELTASGFMSNRGRQNVASFLTKNLRIDWRMGAEWFESLLIDYDVASNWGNWCYVAGVGNDAREFRVFNIHKQALDYDPQGAYVRHWLPALRHIPGAKAHRPDTLTADEQVQCGCRVGSDYPSPMVNLFESANASAALYRAARR